MVRDGASQGRTPGMSEPIAIGPLPPLNGWVTSVSSGDRPRRHGRRLRSRASFTWPACGPQSLAQAAADRPADKTALSSARRKQRPSCTTRTSCRSLGVGEHDGLPYYVMQFIPGLGLDEVLEELQRLQFDEPGGVSPGRIDKLTGWRAAPFPARTSPPSRARS